MISGHTAVPVGQFRHRAESATISKPEGEDSLGKPGQKISIENMHDLAKTHAGECLSDFYTNAITKLRWCCAEGHEFEATPNSVQQRHWP